MKTISILLTLLVTTGIGLFSQQKSDYETVQKFQNITKSISKNIEQAKTVQECAEASASIDVIEKDFLADKALLDKAIFPDGYGRTIEQLRGKLLIRQRDLGVIESQIIRIAELEVTVRELSDQVARLNVQNDKLMADVKQLSLNIQKLSGDLFTATTPIDSLRNLVVKLRQGLQERDALIFALTDSLFLQYDKNIAGMKDVEKQGLLGKMEKHTIVGNVKRAIIDNMMFLATTQLKGSDLVTLVRQQQRFRSQWTGLGPKIANLYLSGKTKKKNEVQVVDSMLTVWGKRVNGAMWRSLHNLFKDKGILLKEFNNGDEFVANLSFFIEEQIQNTAKDDDQRYKLFMNFNENIWQPELRTVWLSALVELGEITEIQKKDIELKVDEWSSSVTPSATWLIYILVALGAAIVAILLVRFLRKPAKPTS